MAYDNINDYIFFMFLYRTSKLKVTTLVEISAIFFYTILFLDHFNIN